MFERLEYLIGTNKLNILRNKHILIVGIGGVGGNCFEALIRSNIGQITIIDHDIIDLTNLNRQVITNQDNIGQDKVKIAKLRGLSINPNAIINDYKLFLDEINIEKILVEKYDYIIDACDTLKTKLLLIEWAHKNNIKIISSMGMANKMDPSKICITDIKKTSYDPIAKIIRKNIKYKLMVVSSNETIIKNNGNKLGSNSFVPAIAGLYCASYVINDLIK